MNDRKEDAESAAQAPVDVLALITHALLISMGVATIVLSPLAMVLAHLRFTNPWPKVAALGGALLAILFLEVALPQVVIGFVFGLFVADAISKEMDLFKLLTYSVLVALVAGMACLFGSAYLERMNVGEYWVKWVDGTIAQIQGSIILDKTIEWTVVRGLLLYEGPFLYLSAALMSVWLSVGMAAHFGWIKEGHKYSASALRNIRLPKWLSLGFVALFAATFLTGTDLKYVIGGVFRIVSAFMFIQGCICLSVLLQPKGVRQGVRTVLYSMAVLLGFYAVVGMGVMSPWFLRKKRDAGLQPPVIAAKLEEQT